VYRNGYVDGFDAQGDVKDIAGAAIALVAKNSPRTASKTSTFFIFVSPFGV